jgi:hypothetical protein
MEIDPIPEDIRAYLRKHFREVKDEQPQGHYYVFSLKSSSGQIRELKVHEQFFMYLNLVPDYLRDHDLAGQLERGNIEIAKPASPA